MKKIKIALVDDNSFLIASIKEKLSFFDDIQIKAIAENGQILIDILEKDALFDLILMDIEMPVLNGIEATFRIKQKHPQIKIIMLTVFDNDENIFNAIKAGADGYLLKEVNPETLHKGIKDTLCGGAAMNPSIALKTLKLLRNPENLRSVNTQADYELSDREVEVLEQLSKGLNYHLIAKNLVISPSTVRKHIENIYKKLQVHSKIEAVEKARINNIL